MQPLKMKYGMTKKAVKCEEGGRDWRGERSFKALVTKRGLKVILVKLFGLPRGIRMFGSPSLSIKNHSQRLPGMNCSFLEWYNLIHPPFFLLVFKNLRVWAVDENSKWHPKSLKSYFVKKLYADTIFRNILHIAKHSATTVFRHLQGSISTF